MQMLLCPSEFEASCYSYATNVHKEGFRSHGQEMPSFTSLSLHIPHNKPSEDMCNSIAG
jgi:hypothetical protein